MDISGIISALVVGVVIGALGRLVLPGRQRVGLLWTVVVGVVAAFVGTGIASGLGVADTRGFDWIELIIQVALAAVGVGALERARAGGRAQR
ncbi:GlsB/YeaQ/YmgE family stress response membrane protein [Streptomyces sp. NPDC006992]|uniref:GlsB/YeaQ/YmgE family stress response membrane protein n=1 Tax=unclassified Streptomyces TaxID=2593676 RepID=UPI0033C39D64